MDNLYQNAVATWKNNENSLVWKDGKRVEVLRNLIENGEFEIPRLGKMNNIEREFWEELAEYSNLDRNVQIQVFVDFVKRKVPERYWINLD